MVRQRWRHRQCRMGTPTGRWGRRCRHPQASRSSAAPATTPRASRRATCPEPPAPETGGSRAEAHRIISTAHTVALLGLAALLASMTVATVAAPAAAKGCVSITELPGYPTGQDGSGVTVQPNQNVCGTSGADDIDYIDAGGTFNGGAGEDQVDYIAPTQYAVSLRREPAVPAPATRPPPRPRG